VQERRNRKKPRNPITSSCRLHCVVFEEAKHEEASWNWLWTAKRGGRGGANLESLPTRYVSTRGNTVVTSYNHVNWLECLLTPMLIPLPSDFLVETWDHPIDDTFSMRIFNKEIMWPATFHKGFSTTVFKLSLPVLCGYVFYPDRGS
jgi:hypothetical protein